MGMGRTKSLIYPKNGLVGLSNMFEILYSKFWASAILPNTGRVIPTHGFNNSIRFFPLYSPSV